MINELALSAIFFDEPTVEKWAAAKAAGLVDSELALARAPSNEEMLARGESQYAMLTEAGVKVSSAHLPFGREWEISSTDADVRKKVAKGYKELLKWVGGKGIDIAVLHPSFEPIPDETRAAQLKHSAACIEEISAAAGKEGVRIAVENLPRTCLGNCASDMLELTRNGQAAKICFDVNHLLIETHEDFIPKVAPHVITTHLSDYDRVNERHWIPGDGIIDWALVVRMLKEAGYAGRFLFEVHEHCLASEGRAITPKELAERFKSLI